MDKEIIAENFSNPHIILVTGGQRSGKSEFAEKFAFGLSRCPVYVATAVVADEEMQKRVDLHKKRREHGWKNLEAPLVFSSLEVEKQDVVLLDCLTLLATNWFFEEKENVGNALTKIKDQLDILFSKVHTVIVVTNEIGLGGISPNKLQRKFTDLQGWINQYVASLAEEVYLMVSGIPVKIK